MDTHLCQPPQNEPADTQEAPKAPRPRRIGWRRHAILAAFLAFYLSQRHAGSMLIFVFLWMAPWLLYTLFRCQRHPAERQARLINVGMWCVCIAIVLTSHIIMHHNAQTYANQVATQIEAYHAQHGSYPSQPEDICISNAAFRDHLGYGGYFYKDGQPNLFYASTYVPFELESYDFTRHTWQHIHETVAAPQISIVCVTPP